MIKRIQWMAQPPSWTESPNHRQTLWVCLFPRNRTRAPLSRSVVWQVHARPPWTVKRVAHRAVDAPLLPRQSWVEPPIKNANWDLLNDFSDLWRQRGFLFCWWDSALMLVDVWGQFAVLSGTLHTYFVFYTVDSPPVSSGPGLFPFKQLIQILSAHFHDNGVNSVKHPIRRENSWSGISIINCVIESLHRLKSASLRRCCSQRSTTQTKQTKLRQKENSLSFFSSLSLMLKITLIIECIMVCSWELRFSSKWRPTTHLLLMSLWEAAVSIIIYISICRSTPLPFELWHRQSWTLLHGR